MPEAESRAKESCVVFVALCLLMSVLWLGSAYGQVEEEIAAEHGYIRAGNDQLFYDLLGQGKALVLLHDGLLHRVTWDEQFPVLAERFEVVRYDRRGYGRSSRPREPYSDVADLRVLFDSLRIDRAALIGCSSGASLAINFALEYPDRVDALVLVGPVVSGLDYSEHFHTRGGRWVWTDETSPEDVIQYWAVTDPYEIAPHNLDLKERVKRLLSVSPQNIEPDKFELRQPPDRPAVKFLTEIAVPVLIVVGESDIPDVHAHAGAIEAGVDNAWRVVIRGCGHLVHLEAPDIFNELVIDFLKELD
ncbi:MAG: alpha/beta hydrolase [Candidatus Eiseniibacteriota bacterium]|nr:MAG: alpha/beta hydrolase [Candidatus Eisenbacteria bacterium]